VPSARLPDIEVWADPLPCFSKVGTPSAVGTTDRVYPLSYRTIYRDVSELAEVLGVPASPRDLRRSFGRILYGCGVNVNTIRALYNPAATERTLYYIGETLDGVRDAVETFDTLRPRTPLAVQVSA
jgi:hypothetical protein